MTSDLTLSSSIPVLAPLAHKDQKKDYVADVRAWCGRSISVVKNGCLNFHTKLGTLVQKTLICLNHLQDDTNALAALFRKLDKYVLIMVEHTANLPGRFKELTTKIKHTVGVIDVVQVAADIDYFVNQKYKNDNKLGFGARIALTVADIGGALLWFEEMGFYTLSKAAVSIGEMRIFSFVPKVISSIPGLRDSANLQRVANNVGNVRVFSWINKISLGFVAERALSIAYLFLAAESFQRLINAPTATHKTTAGLDLASYISELALDALVIIGVTNVISLGVMGATCLSLALASFLYRTLHKEDLEKTPKLDIEVQQKQVVVG